MEFTTGSAINEGRKRIDVRQVRRDRDAMTNPYLPPPVPAKRSAKPWVLLGTAVLAVFVLCCGGFWAVGTFSTTPKKAAVAEPVVASVAVTTTPATVAPTTSVAAAPTTTSPSPKPATRKPTTKPAPEPKPKPKPTTKKPTTPSRQAGVHPGAFCAPEGALGVTVKGTPMRCTRKAGEDRARWRAA